MEKRINTFDIAKGIGIISIIIGHLGISQINQIVFTYHVPLFFIISGYFFKPIDAKHLITKKAKQLLIPYIITCIAICSGSVLLCLFRGNSFTAELKSWLIASLYGAGDTWEWPFHVRAIGAIWFLWALFWGFLIANYSLKKETGIIWAISLAYLGIISSNIIWLPLSIQAGCTASLYILLGYGARKYGQFPIKKGPHLFISVLVWIWSIQNFQGFWLVHNYFGNGILDFLGSLCAVYVVIYLSQCIEALSSKVSCFFKFFGTNSLYILCFHIFELNLFPWYIIHQYIENAGCHRIFGLLVIIIMKLLFASSGIMVIKLTARISLL